jgi:DNA-binding transcriptional MerR regulator/effector-binding domain-containing protein
VPGDDGGQFGHDRGLLVPAETDQDTGYRRYTTGQIPAAQVIRRFRDLDMPLEQIQAVLDAPDVRSRNRLIPAHLTRLEQELTRTRGAVASLRDLLADPAELAPVTHRRLPAVLAASITSVVGAAELLPWFRGALGELYATLQASGVPAAGPAGGPAGGSYATGLFSEEKGEATVFVPTRTEVPLVGRVAPRTLPAAELAVIVHNGSHDDVDRSYGALASYVAGHALLVDGPIREYYLVGWHDTADESAWRTEVCWPIFSTGPALAS